MNALLVGVGVIALGWNLVGNLVLPGEFYVPANLFAAAIVVWLARRAGLTWDDLGLDRRDVRRGLLVGFAAAILVAAVLFVAVNINLLSDVFESEDVRIDSSFDHWFVPVVRIPLGTALFEEILFRSVLLGALLTRTSARNAVVATSVAFGLWHVVPAWEGASGSSLAVAGTIVGTVMVTTLAGAAFATLRLWSGSIVAPIIAHAATNSFAYVAALVTLELI